MLAKNNPTPWNSWIDWGLDRKGENLTRLDLLPYFLDEVQALRKSHDDLLEACKAAWKDIHGDCTVDDGCSSLCHRLAAAIAKAEEREA